MEGNGAAIMQRVLGEVKFNKLELLFNHGVTSQGPEYNVHFSLIGGGHIHLGAFPSAGHLFRHGTLQKAFLKRLPEDMVDEMLKSFQSPEYSKECVDHAANLYLRNESVAHFLRGINCQDPIYLNSSNPIHSAFWTPEFLTGLAFGRKTADEMRAIRETALSEMETASSKGGFAKYVQQNLIAPKLPKGWRDNLGHYVPEIRAFRKQLFNALCKDGQHHNEDFYLTTPTWMVNE